MFSAVDRKHVINGMYEKNELYATCDVYTFTVEGDSTPLMPTILYCWYLTSFFYIIYRQGFKVLIAWKGYN